MLTFKHAKMKIVSVVGARPNFMKVAPIIRTIEKYNESYYQSPITNHYSLNPIHHILAHTGQHYDNHMSDAFFKDLGLPKPDIYLGIGSDSHAVQTAEIMKRFEKVLLKEKPDIVIVVGDVNSTLACALVASKIEYPTSNLQLVTCNLKRRKPLIAHVEAGLRSFDRSMPEEINRILTDHISDFLFVTEPSGIENLKNEGFKNFLDCQSLTTNRQSPITNYQLPLVAYVGNTMIDTLLKHRQKAQKSDILYRLGLIKDFSTDNGQLTTDYCVLTLHRPSNVDNKETFLNIIEALKEISKHIPIIFPAHPRTQTRIKQFRLEQYFKRFSTSNLQLATCNSGIYCIEPLGYLDFLCLMSNAKIVLTDSGGIQEETTILGIPCVTIRENTERPITVKMGTNIIAGTKKENIVNAAFSQLNKRNNATNPIPLWDGQAAKRIVKILVENYQHSHV